MVIFQYNLYIFGVHLWTVLYPQPCYNKLCYKAVVVYQEKEQTNHDGQHTHHKPRKSKATSAPFRKEIIIIQTHQTQQ